MDIPPSKPVTVPAGDYRLRQRETRHGDALFALHLVVADGAKKRFDDRLQAFRKLFSEPLL